MGVVRLVEDVAVVHYEMPLADQGVELGEVGFGIGDVRVAAPDDGCDLVPFPYPGLFGEDASFVGAADEGVQQHAFVDEAVKDSGQVHPDIVVPVSYGGIAGRGLGISGAVEVLAVFPEFGEEVVPGRSGVGDEVAWAEVVLAEILVDVGDAGLGVLPKLGVDGVFDAARPAGGEKEDGQRGCQAGEQSLQHCRG